MPVKMLKPTPMIQKYGSAQGKLIRLSATELKYGSIKNTSSTEKIKANAAINMDSLKNWVTNCFRTEPIAFRIPTSLARFSERAVLKFMKLIQASINTKAPMVAKSQTLSIRPPVLNPFLKSE